MSVEVIKARMLGDVPHGFLGRMGGVSTGIYAGLNVGLGSEDEREAVLENRSRAGDAVLPGTDIARVYQIHSPDVVTITDAIDPEDPPKGDAMVTNRPGLLLGIVTADCVPVLFADAQAGVIGATSQQYPHKMAAMALEAIASGKLPEIDPAAGFFDTGTSGNTRSHMRPARLVWRAMARRAASI